MSILIQPSVGDLATSLGIVLPALADFQLGMPLEKLTMLRRWNARVTETSGAVSLWDGIGGGGAQATATRRPSLENGYIEFDGVDDFIPTDVAPMTHGYLVVKVLGHAAGAGQAVFAGSFQGSTQRVAIGCDASERPAANIGSLNFAFYASTTMVEDTEYVLGVHWNATAGEAEIRVDGNVLNTSAYTGDAGNVGVAIGARRIGSVADVFSGSPERIILAAMYGDSAPLSSSLLDEIDAAAAAY